MITLAVNNNTYISFLEPVCINILRKENSFANKIKAISV